MKIVLCAGGTGGHLFPVIALFDAFKQKGHDVSIVTDKRGAHYCEHIEEKEIIPTTRFSLRHIALSVIKSIKIGISFAAKWYKNRPDVFVGFGGIATIVPALIAKLYGAKVVIYEQNAIVGRANRCLSNFADFRMSTFALGNDWKVQAAPVRKEFLESSAYSVGEAINILVIGGSQGAKSFASIIPEALKGLTKEEKNRIFITQQESYRADDLKETYEKIGIKCDIREFIDDVASIMNKCQLVICRSGASTLAELSAIGRPAILIPYPFAADNHQWLNAKRYEQRNAAWIIEEEKNAVVRLKSLLSNILRRQELLTGAASNIINSSLKHAAEDFVRLIEKLGDEE